MYSDGGRYCHERWVILSLTVGDIVIGESLKKGNFV